MPALVLDLEWSASLPALTSLRGRSLVALVRWEGAPVGLIRLPAGRENLAASDLRQAILDQVAFPTQAPLPLPENVPPASIIVCTRDRPALLHACLEALHPLASQGNEVIVVDNAPSSQAAAELVQAYPYRYLCEPLPGLNRARNRGLQAARHDLVAFTDDDCLPDPTWLRALLAPYARSESRSTGPGAVTGLVLPKELDTTAQEEYEAYCANRRIFQPRWFQSPPFPPSAAGAVGMGANMSFRRARLLSLGGFDPRFDGGAPTLSGGDTEAFARLLASGAAILYQPRALVWHRHPQGAGALQRVIFGYGVGLYAFLTKRLVEDHDWQVLLTAPRWLAGPPAKALWNRLRRRPAAPPGLVLREFWGALHGPGRFFKANRTVKEG